MPAPERTSRAAIVEATLELVERGGADAVTMKAVAARVGIQAPSLYKRVRGRDQLLALAAEATVDELAIRLAVARREGGAAGEALRRLARALRDFAKERPGGYGLVMGPLPAVARPRVDALQRASAPVLEVTAELAGEAHALEAARTVTAWANGFILMELAGAFQLGGDVEAAFDWGLERMVAAISR
jgi:AcrR family transcriptional regulator